MANEVVEDLRRGVRSILCLKVDFKKAYDSVRWEFLYDMLHRMGFYVDSMVLGKWYCVSSSQWESYGRI